MVIYNNIILKNCLIYCVNTLKILCCVNNSKLTINHY